MRRIAVLLAAVLMVLLAGCALPARPDGPVSTALADPSTTTLYRMVDQRLPHDGRSGFRILPVASYAFATRIALAQRAEKTLDVQYYLFKNDNTGRAVMRALANAAARGVRVRVLIDDLYSIGEDRILADLNSLPNVEVRLFNPFAGGRSNSTLRLLGAAFDLERINRRMHNKLFIADNSAALVGGRNLADEYFMNATGSNFVDIDVFVAGPSVPELSRAFDQYWNSDRTYTLQSVVDVPADVPAARAEFRHLTDEADGPPPDNLPAEFSQYSTLPTEIRDGVLLPLEPASAKVIADDPNKPLHLLDRTIPTVTRTVLAKISEANGSVEIVSPYFVPGDIGISMMKAAKAEPGTIRVFTNSLASTDAPLAENGYMGYRKRMLENNVDLYEMSPTLTRSRERLGAFRRSLGSLHAKCVIIDRRFVFLGSMNLDARSSLENTEVGVIIDSSPIANQIANLLDLGSFYHLRLDDAGEIEWISNDETGEHVFHHDPETTWWQRVTPAFTGFFVPEDQL